ncbi:MAG: sporulation inhibitor KapD [Bacillus sp. (in: firmicutes)]|jgi:sporulation inhibitor KapD|uniref:3'-5' exonuclease KapD n=1 Tax=Bacillus sp. 1NLA3E TaxID=666686 RepID=UPI000247F39E|nr:3'-5' exonuclease KapD [Bacillus sp. 1NLA3E]AGK55458.1 sporulation inhibitor KapD [Bacillus sp. 1NLA3E]MDF2904527.1 sporulation inhibitor KapD [Bacillus sp. (in: firmicutes)]
MRGSHQYLFIDFEFTMPEKSERYKGFYPEIIEAGIVSVVDDKVQEQFSSYVTPIRFPILSERCKSFLRISQGQVEQGIPFQDLIRKMNELNNSYPSSIITWGNMDMRVLRNNCHHADLMFPFTGKEIDLSMEYKRFFGDQNQTGLWKAVQEYGKEGTGKHHRALDDAMTTFNIFKLVEKDKKYLEKPKPPTIGDRVDFSKLFNKFA